jgi:hypothetical protein
MMENDGNYGKIVAINLRRLFEDRPEDLEKRLPAQRTGDCFSFPAFGCACELAEDSIRIDGQPETGVLGILISLYALNARVEPCTVSPLKGFKELPDSMPYIAAFANRTQQALVPHVAQIEQHLDRIAAEIGGRRDPPGLSGDFSVLLFPLPKIALGYIFYRADDDFPASVTCLFSANAPVHLSTDALADVGEYTSRQILRIIGK